MKTSKKGITLVEAICTLAIVGFLLVTIGSALTGAGRQFAMLMERARAKNAVVTITHMMESKLNLAFAATLQTEQTRPSGTTMWYTKADGYLYSDPGGVMLFAKEYYAGYKIQFEYKKQSDRAASIIATAFDSENKLLYSQEITVALINTKVDELTDIVKTAQAADLKYPVIVIYDD